MIWYFIVALFWASAVLYIIGLLMGIFTFEQKETTITFAENPDIEQQEENQSANPMKV